MQCPPAYVKLEITSAGYDYLVNNLQWIYSVKKWGARANAYMCVGHGEIVDNQNPNLLLFRMSLKRMGFDPDDADRWVEEPINGPDHYNDFELAQLPPEAMVESG